jgi:hypothetical protein
MESWYHPQVRFATAPLSPKWAQRMFQSKLWLGLSKKIAKLAQGAKPRVQFPVLQKNLKRPCFQKLSKKYLVSAVWFWILFSSSLLSTSGLYAD